MGEFKTVNVIGLGYVGLPTAALLAKYGYQVRGVDISPQVVDVINRGDIHIVEPKLRDFVRAGVSSGALVACLEPSEADVFIIAVPSPFYEDQVNKKTSTPKPNISYILDATRKIAPYIKAGDLVILESTSPVGTTDQIRALLHEEGAPVDEIHIAHAPERVLPGRVMEELIANDRIVGGVDEVSTEKARAFFASFVDGEIHTTNARTAEMAKLTENAYRDVNLAFANELSMLCDDLNIDVRKLISLANMHPRVDILSPGCGVGGHCISVDPWFIVDKADGNAKLVEQARKTNDFKPQWVIHKILEKIAAFEAQFGRAPSVACMGLAFKPNIDDLRESPAAYIAEVLNSDCDLVAVEPNIHSHKSLTLVSYQRAVLADICIYLVAHDQFLSAELGEYDMDFCGLC
jgi:UDP-N-acetyl-D-mannosaminuronic acid dehydrogenase